MRPLTSHHNLCVQHLVDGLREGLTHFSQPSRVALLFALGPDQPLRIHDPQNLLRGHEPKLEELYLESQQWRLPPGPAQLGEGRCERLELSGLVACGGRADPLWFQMWFTEHHPDMCSTGPTERWLEYAAGLLAQDMAGDCVERASASAYVLQEYATHAVRDFLVDERNRLLGPDSDLRVYPLLDAVLSISKTREEGAWPRGRLAFVEPAQVRRIACQAVFPAAERPRLSNHKHVRKLLQAAEGGGRLLVSDGDSIVGIACASAPPASILADFRGSHGFLSLEDRFVCSFADGRFSSSTHRAKLVQLEEGLLETTMPAEDQHALFGIVSAIVHAAEEERYGCALAVDLGDEPAELAGQTLVAPLDLRDPASLDLAIALSRMDGALHIARDLTLRGFGCLLDGRRVAGENRARGARFNSALRFTAEHDKVVAVVVSSDRPVSVIQNGVELTAQCEWLEVKGCPVPPTLEEWLKG